MEPEETDASMALLKSTTWDEGGACWDQGSRFSTLPSRPVTALVASDSSAAADLGSEGRRGGRGHPLAGRATRAVQHAG